MDAFWGEFHRYMFPSASVNIGLPSGLVKGMCPGDSGEFVSYKGRGTFSDLT